jgi:type I restriction enzyme S subunit
MRSGWEKRRLRDVTSKIGSGATPLGGEAAYKTSGISLIRSLNVHDGGFRTKDLAFN